MAALPTAAFEWIAQRLPSGLDASGGFTKNGVTKTVRQAVDAAYADHADKGDGRKYYALADLLEILAADQRFQSQTQGPFSGQGPLLMDRAKYFRQQGLNVDTVPAGTFAGVNLRFAGDRSTVRDEYSDCDGYLP